MVRPSPRTLGKTVDPETGEEVFFTKFGTQQLKFIDPAKPASGVREVVPPTFGGSLKGFFGSATIRDTAYPELTITKGVGTFEFPDLFPTDNGNGNGECDLGCLLTARGCDCGCKDLKPCTTCDSTVCAECNAWDLQCEDCHNKAGTCTPPETPPSCDMGCWLTGRGCECNGDNGKCDFWDIGCKVGSWWDKYGIIVMIIGGLIGLGIVLWLLRPLFSMIRSFQRRSNLMSILEKSHFLLTVLALGFALYITKDKMER